jgi:hypothetical protein
MSLTIACGKRFWHGLVVPGADEMDENFSSRAFIVSI